MEKGRKRPSYETLARLTERLGIPPETLFLSKEPVPADKIQPFLEDLQSCGPKNQGILLKTMHFLAEQLRTSQDEPEEEQFYCR